MIYLIVLLVIGILAYCISRKPKYVIQSKVSPRQEEILTLKANIYVAPYSKSFVKKTKLRYN